MFVNHRVRTDTLLDFSDNELEKIGIIIIGDRKAIFKHARKVLATDESISVSTLL